jgi:hypothetical protein
VKSKFKLLDRIFNLKEYSISQILVTSPAARKITGRKCLIDDDNTYDAYLDVDGKLLFDFTKVGEKLMVYEPESINTLATDAVEEWHKRYGYLPLKSFYSIQEAPPGLTTHKSLECKVCTKGKSVKMQARHKPTRFVQLDH